MNVATDEITKRPLAGLRRMKTILNLRNLFAVLMAIGLMLPTASFAGAKAEHIASAKAGFDICMTRFPETKKTTKILKGDGWRFLGILGDFRAYTKHGKRVLAATTVTHSRDQGCFVAVRKLTSAEAVTLAKSILKNARSVKQTEVTEADSVAEWTAVVNGKKVRFAVSKPFNFNIFHGAAVTMLNEN